MARLLAGAGHADHADGQVLEPLEDVEQRLE
jgi:hypothetical protein